MGCFVWVARRAIIGRAEREAIDRLAQNGIYLQYSRRSWSSSAGLRLEGVVLHRDAQINHPVVEISELNLGVPLREVFKSRSLISHWKTKDATVVFHDDSGRVDFSHVTTNLISQSGQLDVSRFEARRGALVLDLNGRVLVPPTGATSTPAASFALDLSTARRVLDVLDFPTDAGTFTVRGSVTMDLRNDDKTVWHADVTGEGERIRWREIPMKHVKVQGRLSSDGMDLISDLRLTAGTAKMSLLRRDWDDTPLVLTGSLTDTGGASDEFSASYDRSAETWVVSRLAGKADLLAFAHNFPTLEPLLPTFVQVSGFPEHTVTDFSWSQKEGSAPVWSLGAIEVRGPSNLTFRADDAPLQMKLSEGSASFANGAWKGQLSVSEVTWRDLQARTARVDGTLAGRRLKSTVDLGLTRGSAKLAISSDDYDRGPFALSGSLTDSNGRADRFTATYRREPATLQVAQLAGKADLLEFATNFPSLPSRLPQAVKLRSFPEIAVTDLTWRPGKPPTFESVRLVSPADVSVTIKGHAAAIDQLSGQAAFDGQRWKLSKVSGRVFGGQATLDGVYENDTLRDATITASKVRLAQLKPWLGESQNTLGDATMAFDYRGSISANPSRMTGAGQLHLENAPIVAIPLLDQTYALFSVLSSPLQRRGSGSMDAKFTAAKGIVTVSEFTARGDSARVTASGTIDLNRRQVDGRARGNIRGIFGVVTGPLSRALEMQVSGPLDNIRVRPLGFGGILTGTLTGAAEIVPKTLKHSAKLPASLLRDGVGLPLKALDLFKPDSDPARPK